MNLTLDDDYEENLSIEKDEYIKSLEISVQLLQREIEHLRKKLLEYSTNEIQNSVNTNFNFDGNNLINKVSSKSELISATNSIISSNKLILEWQIFLINSDSSFTNLDNSVKNDKIIDELSQLTEDGVTDWILSNDEVKLAPSLLDSTESRVINNLFVPVLSTGSQSLLFFGKISEEQSNILEEFKLAIKQVMNAIALKLDNIISSEHITDISKQLENNVVNRKSSNSTLLNIALSEFEQPIEIIEANLEFIDKGIGNPVRRSEIIKDNLNFIKVLKNKLIKINSEKQNSNIEFSFNTLIEEIAFITKNQLQRDGIALNINISKDIIHKADKKEVESLFTYLVLFSADLMPDGGNLVLNSEKRKSNITFKFYYENALLTESEFETIISGTQPEDISNNVFTNMIKLNNLSERNNFELSLINDRKIGTSLLLTLKND